MIENTSNQFEVAWREGYEFFERVYDPLLKRSVKNKINLPYEWYEPSSRGLYTAVNDSSIKLDKKQGRARDGREHYGFTDPLYRSIRENYWGTNYNKTPRVWWLDIETRSGRSYKHAPIGDMKIRVTNSEEVLEGPVKGVQDKFYNQAEENYQFLCADSNEWKPLRDNFFMQRNKGFPKPELALEEICMFQIFDSELEEVIMIGLKDWKHKDDYQSKFEYPVKYVTARDELHLIEIYLHIFKQLNPVIVYAWNGLGFDYPYIFNRMKRLGLDVNAMSNYGECTLQEKEFMGRIEFNITTPGHYYIDLMEAYKKFVLAPRSSYSLDEIAFVELKERKVQHDEYAQFDHFYLGLYNIPEDPTEEQKNSRIYQEAKNGITEEVQELGHSEFCWYSYKDPLLIMKIDKKVGITDLIIASAEKMGVLLTDSFGTVRPWSQFIANTVIQNNQVLPPRQDHEHPNVVGGYVMEPVRGRKSWVLSADVASMYPNAMIAYNMSPETILETHEIPDELKDIMLTYFCSQDEEISLGYSEEIWNHISDLLRKHNLTIGINGAVFNKESTGFLPNMVSQIYNERVQTRKIEDMYKDRKGLIEEILHSRE